MLIYPTPDYTCEQHSFCSGKRVGLLPGVWFSQRNIWRPPTVRNNLALDGDVRGETAAAPR